MIIGASGSGKSRVANWLNDTNKPLKKRQDAIYGSQTIDIPAAYLENPSMYRYIFSLSQTAGMVILLGNGEDLVTVFPPNFARTFVCPVVGLITGASKFREAERILKDAGVSPPYYLFDATDQQLGRLKVEWLKKLLEKGKS